MEKAIFISRIEELKNLKNLQRGYDRFYFGNEFCEFLIPKKAEITKILDFVSRKDMNFTFVTPYVTDKGLEKLAPLINLAGKLKPGSEVVFNDWGVLELINKRNLKPVLGRLLTKQKRGPRIMNILETLPASSLEYFKKSNTDAFIIQEFLLENNIKRVELDNLLQSIDQDFSQTKIRASLYYPFLYLTTTRRCVINSCDIQGNRKIGIYPCNKECRLYTVEKENEVMLVKLILKGNTIFFRNDNLPKDLEKKGINRVVYQPKIPI